MKCDLVSTSINSIKYIVHTNEKTNNKKKGETPTNSGNILITCCEVANGMFYLTQRVIFVPEMTKRDVFIASWKKDIVLC